MNFHRPENDMAASYANLKPDAIAPCSMVSTIVAACRMDRPLSCWSGVKTVNRIISSCNYEALH